MIPNARTKQPKITKDPMRNGSGRKAVDKTPAIIGPKIFPILTYDALSPNIEP